MHAIWSDHLARRTAAISAFLLIIQSAFAQVTVPVNGVQDKREKNYAFIHATIVKDDETTIPDGTLLTRNGKIEAVGAALPIPTGAVVVDCRGKFIYPSFLDIYSDYGIPVPQRPAPGQETVRPSWQMNSNTKGAYDWNQAIKPEIDASRIFAVDDSRAKPLRDLGFGTVLTHQKDGIARGTGAVVTLANEKENLVLIKPRASAHYSFSKGTSIQAYPGSLMGCIALLRQTFLDAAWYKGRPDGEGENLSLQAWLDNQGLPQIFEANDKWNDLRADRIGDEFGVQFIIKGGDNEYQRIQDIAGTGASFILTLNFPVTPDVEDPNDARFVSLADMKNWELAPGNPAALEKAGIPFCLTTSDLRDVKQFSANLRKALDYGLSEKKALEALTRTPATLLGIYGEVGSLDPGKLANFLILSGPMFRQKTVLLENWIQGQPYEVHGEEWNNISGSYRLDIQTPKGILHYGLEVQGPSNATVVDKDSLNTRFSYDGKFIHLSFSNSPLPRRRATDTASGRLPTNPGAGRGGRMGRGSDRTGPSIRLSGTVNGDSWNGNGEDSSGNPVLWTASLQKAGVTVEDSTRKKPEAVLGKVLYPFDGFGWDEMPKAEDLLIRNATVWTNEAEGRLEHTDVLVRGGKIARIGSGINEPSVKQIDGTGKYLTPGIVDEHSHIAAASINEGGHSVTSEVRIGDNLNPEDINIYRQLAGGVTSSHILHGSANTIGGQTQLIKLRWGDDDQGLKFKNWDPFIKFALGENVKRTTSQNNARFPDTRMGVEEVMNDAFQRATDYAQALKRASSSAAKGNPGVKTPAVRRNLQLDALVEIMQKKRFITCHSYVQSEITMLMRVADKFGFRVNTFTHVLEGYKVADKLKAHGANVSTFSDWWAYKVEVEDAIAYNAALMVKAGLNVCINSDDPEMARRLNQEAAKSVKYGGLSEEEAFKMVTLNPARALHVDDRVGSIKVGKDADLVLWSDNPLSVYARAEKTLVDGIVYYDVGRDSTMRQYIQTEKNRLIQKMISEKRSGSPVEPAIPSFQYQMGCGDHASQDGLITIEDDGDGTDSSY